MCLNYSKLSLLFYEYMHVEVSGVRLVELFSRVARK